MPLWPTWSRHPVEARETRVRFQRAAHVVSKGRAVSLECRLVLHTELARFDSWTVHVVQLLCPVQRTLDLALRRREGPFNSVTGLLPTPTDGNGLAATNRDESVRFALGVLPLSINRTGRSFPKREVGVRIPAGALRDVAKWQGSGLISRQRRFDSCRHDTPDSSPEGDASLTRRMRRV
jgi:hypothetical protein